eukprot:TRINITY_DN5066_c0_g1_i1.p1 TRINITY_DN5066_c0_g1~~TRINITY_DN5066_c0_g1_i1.p1  ORF type:complete len:573 (+),score=93.23 TRINITY_DN5066_c0_g1_i1:94-1812(+)
MGQTGSSNVLFRQIELLPVRSNENTDAALQQLFATYDRGAKGFLAEAEFTACLDSLYRYLRERDRGRLEPLRDWSKEPQEEIISEWYSSFDPQHRGFILFDTFATIVQLLLTPETLHLVEVHHEVEQVQTPPTPKSLLNSLAKSTVQALGRVGRSGELKDDFPIEENWEVVESGDYNRRAVLEMTAQQISTLWKQAQMHMKRKQYMEAQKCYEDSLVLTDSILGIMDDEIREEFPKVTDVHVHRQLLWIRRQIDECEQLALKTNNNFPQYSGKKSILEKLPANVLVSIFLEISDADFAHVSTCNIFLRNACRLIKPVLNNPMYCDYDVLQGRIIGNQSEFMLSLLPELHIQVLSHLNVNEMLPVRSVCKTLKIRVDSMLKAEFEVMHLNNFIALKMKMEGIADEDLASEFKAGAGTVGQALLQMSAVALKAPNQFTAVLGAACFAIGGLMMLESAVGGPISSNVGKLVEKVRLLTADSKLMHSSDTCSRCDTSFSILQTKIRCRACGLTFCGTCAPYSVPILVANTAYHVPVCCVCINLVEEQFGLKDEDFEMVSVTSELSEPSELSESGNN